MPSPNTLSARRRHQRQSRSNGGAHSPPTRQAAQGSLWLSDMQVMLLYILSCSLDLTRCSSRARHIKCDETRPVCQRCIASRRTCEGYNDDRHDARDSATLVHIAPRRLRAQSAYGAIRTMTNIHMRLSSVECQAFDFFRLETMKQLPGGSSDLLWSDLRSVCLRTSPS